MNCAYRLIWNERLNAWVVAPETASARGKRGRIRRSATALLLTLAIGSHAALAADLAATALPGGGQVAAGQATISSAGANMAISQSSQRAIINWQNFDIGAQASVNFQQPNTSAVTLNRASGPTASRIEGQLSANGQVFLVNPSGVLFGSGARVNVGGLVASTLNIRDDDFLSGSYTFSGNGGSITNQGRITAAPGGYLAFISPTITNNGTLSAPQGTVAMGAGERVRLNFSGDRLLGLDVSADTIDTLITNSQAIRADGGAILLTVAGAEAVTRSVINNTGVLEASSLTSDGGRIVLTAGNDINLGAGSTVAVDGQKGGEITAQAQSGTLLADGQLTARGSGGTGGTVKLLGQQVGMVNTALVDASGTAGGGAVLVGGDYQGKNPDIQNAQRTFVRASATIKADSLEQGNGGKVVVWADEISRYYGSISAKGGSQGGNGGFVEVSGKRDLDFLGAVDVAAPFGTGGRVLLDPQDIVLNNTAQPAPPNNPNGTPDVAFADAPAAGTTTIQIADIRGFSELFLQATRDITVSNPVTMLVNNSIRLEANNNITLATGANITTSGTGSINLKADADNSGAGTLTMNNAALRSNVGGITLSGASISGTGTINTTGAASANGGNIAITGTSAAGSISLTGAMTTTGGTAAAGSIGRNAGNVTVNGAGAVTTGAITASGSNGNGANQAGGNGGVISVASNGALATGNLAASGGNGVATAAGGNAGSIAVSNNSGSAGTLTTGALTARAGAAAGAIVSGNSGDISVTNNAATLLRTGAINTSGQTGASGGNVSLNSAGDVTVIGTIDTRGAGLVAGTTATGRNAGNVTITGANRSVTGTITASGAAGLGTNQAGGNAGVVSITGSGTLSTIGITAQTGAATGTGAGGTVGGITLGGTSVTTGTGALNTTGSANGNAGNINVISTAGNLSVGAVSASGGTANTGTAGRNAGEVTLNSAGTVTASTIAANGAAGSGAAGNLAGGNGAAISISGVGGVTTTAIGASGGAATTTNANGGNAGSITINNSGSGNIQTTTLTARSGASTGSAAGGNQGFIAVTNTAGNVSLGALTTSGQTNGNGGNISANATGLLTLNGAIASSGGANAAATTQAGKNAGTITLSGNGITSAAAATITANGSAGLGTNQAGGNAGLISITGTGTGAIALNTGAAITSSTGAATGTGTGGAVGGITLNGPSITSSGALTTTGAANGNGGNVSATTISGDLSVGAITTSGGAALAGTAGRNAGNVTLTSGGALSTTSTITANGSAGNGTNQAGGNGSNITLDAGGTAPLVTIGGNLSALGGNRTGTGTAGSGGNITIADTLNIGAANRTISSRSGSTGVGAGGNITLGGPIYDDGGVRTVTVTGGSGTVAVAGGAANATLANNLDTLVVTASDGAGKIRVGSVNTVAAQSYNAGTGGIELNGNVVTLGSAGADIVTFSDPVTLTGNSSITTAGGSGDDIAINQTVNGAFGLTLNAGAAGNVSTSVVIGGSTPLSAFSATGAAVTLGQSVTAGSIFARSTTGNITLNTGTVLTGTGTGNAIELAAGGTASRFINNAGAGALNASNVAGRFLAWSQNPANDMRGGLAYDFKQYNATYGVTPVAQPTGNGFLYSLAPTVTPALTGTVSKVYDATTSAPLVAANFTLASGVDGDLIALSGTGAYDNPNVAGSPTKLVTATGIAATVTSSVADGSKPVYGYTLTSTTASANIGEITPAPLTVTGDTTSSVYTATAQTNTFTTSGLLGSDSVTSVATLASGTSVGTYADNLTSATGTGLANYTIGYVNGNLTITPAPLTITGDTTSSLYTSNLQTNTFTTSGLLGSDTVTSVATLASGTNVGTYADTLTSASGSGLSNYTIGYVNGSLSITPAALVITADDASRPVNTSNPQFTATYAGFVGGETPAVLNGVLAFSTPATLISPVGIYSITPYGQSSGNYTVTYRDGILTIQAVPVVTLPFPREVVSQQAIGAQYTDPTQSSEALTGLQFTFEDEHDGKDEKVAASMVRVIGFGIKLPN